MLWKEASFAFLFPMTIALNTYTRSLVLYLALGILEETFNSPNFIDDDDELFLWYGWPTKGI